AFSAGGGGAGGRRRRRWAAAGDFPDGRRSCAHPHSTGGYQGGARNLARHTLRAFDNGQTVVVPSGSCAAMVKLEYPELFHEDPGWRRRAEALAARTHELSDYLVNVLGGEDGGATFRRRVTYHMACHLRRLGLLTQPELLTEPERLLRRVAGLEYVPLERADECCGFGGSFAVRYPAVSGAMVRDKAAFVEKAGVDAVVATDAGCLMNIAGCLRRRGSKVRVMHLAEVLEQT